MCKIVMMITAYSTDSRRQGVSVRGGRRDFIEKKKHIISRVLPGSIAQELELEPGDILAAINDTPVEDVFDYRYLMNDEFVTLLIEKQTAELWEWKWKRI